MLDQQTVVVSRIPSFSDGELREMYGEDIVISRVGRFNLVHLDSPDPEEVIRRIAEFDPADLFEDDCPLCQMLREEGGNVLYGEGEED
ncbi:MAG: hypothetical protein ACRD1R_19710 [Acidobacteriota bacterium]